MADKIDDRETILVNANAIRNTKKASAKALGLIAKKIPAPVATPLPPLNLKNGE